MIIRRFEISHRPVCPYIPRDLMGSEVEQDQQESEMGRDRMGSTQLSPNACRNGAPETKFCRVLINFKYTSQGAL